MKYDREIAVVFNPAVGDFSKKIEGGINYAIFDERKFECKKVKVVHIGNIQYEWSILS